MSLPYFPMYPSDFEADTSHLTLIEDGAYNRLLRLMWLTPGCSLPDDDKWIMRRMRCDSQTYEDVVKPLLDEFFERADGRVFNSRLKREFEQSVEKHEKRVKAGRKGGRKTKSLKNNETGKSNAKAMPKQPEPEPEPYERDKSLSSAGASARPEREDISFDNFLACYPQSAGGSIEAAKREWGRLNLAEQEAAIAGASQLKNSETRYPAVFLAEKRFKVQPREKQMRPVAIPDDGTRERQIYDRACEAKGQGWWVSWLSEARLEGALVLVKSEFAAKKITNEFGRELKAMGLQVRYRNKGAA